MATSETKEVMCLVCLEAPAVRKVDKCQHSYCENCLSSPNFSCPQCVYTNQGSDRSRKEPTGAGGHQNLAARDHSKAPLADVNCKLCHHRWTAVKAVNACKECRKMPLCAACSLAHRKNKITKNHVVTNLVSTLNKDEVLCDNHNEPLELFCFTCSLIVCHVCISLDHVNHDVETFNDVVNTEVEKVRSALEKEKEWLNMLKIDEKELQDSKATAQEMEDVLIKSIEDHAEKCIEEILKNKEALKKQVKADFEAVRVMEKRLEAMPELQRASGDVIAEANSLLNEQAELHSTYIEKLVVLKQQLDKLKEDHPVYEVDKAKYQQTFKKLCEKDITFYPRTPNCKIGGFKDLYAGPRCNAGGPCVCETCERKTDASRVAECRRKGTCTCGTCGCVFDRKQLNDDGRCVGTSLCQGQPWSKVCNECRARGYGCSTCTKKTWCNLISVRNYLP